MIAAGLASCSNPEFTLSGAQLAAAEQKSFEAIQKSEPNTDVLFIAHQWRPAECRRGLIGAARCKVTARISDRTPWKTGTAHLRREKDGSWLLLGVDWPGR